MDNDQLLMSIAFSTHIYKKKVGNCYDYKLCTSSHMMNVFYLSDILWMLS